MGTTMYWLIVVLIIVLGMIMQQHSLKRKNYIILMAALHTVVSGFRYKYITGDLLKYGANYNNIVNYDWFSSRVFNEGINTGFLWLMKLISGITNRDFQVFLFVIALIIEIAVAILIFNYSPRPWLSYLVWNCIGFYIFGFSALKQSLAMALVVIAMIGILEKKPKLFLVFSLLAGFVHFPAFAFLPAYLISKIKINVATIMGYAGVVLGVYVLRNPIVNFMTGIYYEDDFLTLGSGEGVGGRFLLMILILVVAMLVKGFGDEIFEKLFNIMIVAAIFQMFSSYNNVFTRFADYYFQFSILFLPLMISSEETDSRLSSVNIGAMFPFNKQSLDMIAICMMVFLIWYYDYTCLGKTISYAVDNYLDYRFMWWNGG